MMSNSKFLKQTKMMERRSSIEKAFDEYDDEFVLVYSRICVEIRV